MTIEEQTIRRERVTQIVMSELSSAAQGSRSGGPPAQVRQAVNAEKAQHRSLPKQTSQVKFKRVFSLRGLPPRFFPSG